MNTTSGQYESDATGWEQQGRETYFYRTYAGSTASDDVVVSSPEYQSPSMRPPQGREGSDTSLSRCLAWFAGEAIEERLEEALSAKGILIWPHLWRQETESEIEGGVFAPPRERKVLFSKKLKFRVADLPHREHRVTITARMLDVEEEEDG